MKNCNQLDCTQKNPQAEDQFTAYGHCNGAKRGECVTCQSIKQKQRYNKNRLMFRGKLLAKKYWPHLSWQDTLKEYDRLFFAQNGVCAICKKSEPVVDPRYGEPKMLAVDHIHGSSTVRGLLCSYCNQAIGLLQDSAEVLRAAADYVEKHQIKQEPQKETNVIPFKKVS